jgi:hypothetical protein
MFKRQFKHYMDVLWTSLNICRRCLALNFKTPTCAKLHYVYASHTELRRPNRTANLQSTDTMSWTLVLKLCLHFTDKCPPPHVFRTSQSGHVESTSGNSLTPLNDVWQSPNLHFTDLAQSTQNDITENPINFVLDHGRTDRRTDGRSLLIAGSFIISYNA